MAGLRKGIQVTNEFDGYEPPEDTRAYGDAYADDSRMMMLNPRSLTRWKTRTKRSASR